MVAQVICEVSAAEATDADRAEVREQIERDLIDLIRQLHDVCRLHAKRIERLEADRMVRS